MTFNENPYYHPEKCGLEQFYCLNTGEGHDFDLFVIWRKLDDNTLWWDADSGCSRPSPFDFKGIGHFLKPIKEDTWFNFEQALTNHYNISKADINTILVKVENHLKTLQNV